MYDLADDLDTLYGLPLDEFTSTRNEIARRLKPDYPEAAAELKSLQKPSVPAWTVNQLVRTDSEGVRALIEAGEALRAAQEQLLTGDAAAKTIKNATERQRGAVNALMKRAEAVLKEADRPASTAVLERVAATLRAAAVTDEGRKLLEVGRLTEELEPPGFGDFTDSGPPAGKRSRLRSADTTEERRRQRDQEQRKKRELRENAKLLERAARQAERESADAEEAADEARRRAEQARAEADAAAALARQD